MTVLLMSGGSIKLLNWIGIKRRAQLETRFGTYVYRVGSSVLSAGRDFPDTGQTRQGGEGVAVVWKSFECIEEWK